MARSPNQPINQCLQESMLMQVRTHAPTALGVRVPREMPEPIARIGFARRIPRVLPLLAGAALLLGALQPASAALLTLSAIGAGGRDLGANGTFDQLLTGPLAYNTGRDMSGAERRWAMEFDLSGLPTGAVINSVSLNLRTASSSAVGQTALFGYLGDGVMGLTDMTAGSLVMNFTPTTFLTVDYDVTGFVSNLNGQGASWAGFNLRQIPLEAVGSGVGHTWNGPDNFPAPALKIDYTVTTSTVPEPDSMLLVALALGCLLFARAGRHDGGLRG
jgi:hypothetical protein